MKSILILAAAFGIFLLPGCNNPDRKDTAETVTDSSFNIRFNPVPPGDLDSNATAKQLSEFAWEEFLALNWKSAFDETGKRDFPDTKWSYQDSSVPYPSLNVWETFAHRTELRPYSDNMLPFNMAPHYSFGDSSLKPANAATSFTLFNNLDENNEIGSCDVYAHVNLYQKQYQVLYEAKVNSAEYNYILENYPTKARLLEATTNTMQNIARYGAYYDSATGTCDCPKNKKVICLPCGNAQATGTIEIKAAWRKLTPKDNAADFFTRTVIYYSKGADGSLLYNNDVYALIALHIIHKTQNYPAFVFATFEHKDLVRDSMGYVLLDNNGNEYGKLQTPSRDPVRNITQASTDYVHSKLPRNSIWRNYRLVGVQAKPVSYPDSSNMATNFFLSNYGVESDSILSHFNGSSIGNPHDHKINLLYKGAFYSMGGCQGCHGVAQNNLGTDLSFLLDTVGKPVLTPDINNVNQLSKLRRYIQAIQISTLQAGKMKRPER